MKIKCAPEDFQVEELAEIHYAAGPFALYRLTKRSMGTPEAVGAICKAWRIPRQAVSVGGLKDRHAETRQFLSIHRGPRRGLRQNHFELDYLGQSPQAFDSKSLLGNRFEIAARDVDPGQASAWQQGLRETAADGVPNYFDDQRFGSVGESGEFVAHPWCLGNFERALWLALAESNVHDRPRVREEKQLFREKWGNWSACRQAAIRPASRAAMEVLSQNPFDFRKAFVQIPQHERRMFLAAFQSAIWNRILAERIREVCPAAGRFEVELGRTKAPFYRVPLSAEARQRLGSPLPLPSARERSGLGALEPLYERVIGQFGLSCRQLRVKYPRDSFFSRGSRPALLRPKEASCWFDAASRTVHLRFVLQPGAYATVFLKRLTGAG